MKNKLRIIEILSLLYDNTDAEHFETTKTLLAYLEKNSIPVDRKTLQDDMERLVDMNIGIKKTKSSPNKYYWDKRLFTQDELQMLIDIVLSSKAIPEYKCRSLVRKLMKLTSRHNKALFKDEIKYTARPKTENKNVYKTVSVITDAIRSKRRMKFKYTEYDQNKEKVYRNKGEYYHLSPYQLYYNEDFYYVIGYENKHKDIVTFRLDHMEMCSIEKEDRPYIAKPEEFEINKYATEYFKMYDGEEVCVELINQ